MTLEKTLYLEKLTVTFDGFKALDSLSLYVDPGELLCVIGPNGAGKTTMMDVITGKTRPDSGTAWFGRAIDLLSLTEPEIAQAGIGRKSEFGHIACGHEHDIGGNTDYTVVIGPRQLSRARAHRPAAPRAPPRPPGPG